MTGSIFEVCEIMWHVLEYADFRSIVVVGHTNKKGRLYMEFALAALISTMVKPYFPTPRKPLLFEWPDIYIYELLHSS